MKVEEAIQTLNVMQPRYAHIRHSDSEWEAVEMSKEVLQTGFCTVNDRTPKTGPLGLEELRKMSGNPVWVQKEDNELESCWGIVCLAYGQEYVMSFIQVYQGYGMLKVHFSEYGKTWTAYSYPPAKIDWEEWMAKWEVDEFGHKCSKCGEYLPSGDDEITPQFCPSCGRATTEDALAELEKRMEGKTNG